jgi:serine/threonine protein kinase
MQQSTIKNYQIKSELGRGGMATVYKAHDAKFDTDVAIKILHKEFTHNENIRKRFLAEARNMFKMSHPNIIKVSDLVDEGDTVAFVMEYIEGDTLKEYMERKGRLGDEEIKTIFTQILEAVGYVHDQNLVHRDIKPSNFMITSGGKIKLMDFGIAKNTDASSAEYTQTGTGVQMGTPMYMSPEQITETKSVTPQSDIYSLGVVLWQMVRGEKPYDTSTLSSFQLMTKIVNDPLSKTSTIWDDLIQKATEKDLDKRIKKIKEFNLSALISTLSISEETVVHISNPNEVTVLLNNDKTILESSMRQIDKMGKMMVACPRCLGKGFVDENDIKRLKREFEWIPGNCAYCDGVGKVTQEKAVSVPADKADIAYGYDDWAKELVEMDMQNLLSQMSETGEDFDEGNLFESLQSMSNKLKAENLKSYLGKEIPHKKLNNFWKRYQNSTLSGSFFYWYFDNTLFGKGDDGMAIIKTPENRYFLLIAEFAGGADFFELVHFDRRFKDFDGNKRLSDISIIDKGMKMVVNYYQNENEKYLSLDYTGFNKELILAVSDWWDQLPGNAPEFDFSTSL